MPTCTLRNAEYGGTLNVQIVRRVVLYVRYIRTNRMAFTCVAVQAAALNMRIFSSHFVIINTQERHTDISAHVCMIVCARSISESNYVGTVLEGF